MRRSQNLRRPLLVPCPTQCHTIKLAYPTGIQIPSYEILSLFCIDILDQFTPCSLSHRSLQECKQFSTHTSSKKPTYTLQLLIFARKIPKLHYLALKKGKRLQSLTCSLKEEVTQNCFFQKKETYAS